MGSTILITGANGEIGHGLIEQLTSEENKKIVTIDISKLDKRISNKVHEEITGDVLDNELLDELFNKYEFETIYHLAAMLSTSAEKDPVRAHHVNTDGSVNLLSRAEKYARKNSINIKFIFPSSIAVYGLADLETKNKVGKINEKDHLLPTTMYGCNKLYIELLGNYYARYYEKHTKTSEQLLDFRSIRFPGIISAETLPTGGTSDYGPEMLHAAARRENYECFVRNDSVIPFMVMPDAIKALVMISKAKEEQLSTYVYNVGSFKISAEEIAKIATIQFNKIRIIYKSDQKRQAIVDSWPKDVDDSLAREDWGWEPDFNKSASFEKYLVPAIRSRYA